MKKLCLALLILSIFSACSTNNKGKALKKHATNKSKSYRIRTAATKNSKKTRYVLSQKTADEDDDSVETAEMLGENGEYDGHFKIGNPYKVFGVSYVPQDYEDYQETGTASWYGDDFHGKKTANGEVYNMGSMTAAHPTLPLPSLVRVTNLRNGKNVIVRVNDRGPFAKNRVIDVSEKAAVALGFKGQGTTEVKIELLRNDTDALLEKLKISK
jgi:rare lipoprotein A